MVVAHADGRWFFQQLMVSVDYLHRKMEIAHRLYIVYVYCRCVAWLHIVYIVYD